jgi:peptide subunit release factor 1 (eRF1)
MPVQTETDRVQELVDRLAALDAGQGFPVLSLYLDTRPDQHGRDHFQPFVRKELQARRAGFHGQDRHSYDRDASRILQWLADDLDPAANGVALFACDGRDLFEAVQLEAPIEESRLHVDRQPHLYTLARVLDLHPRYVALLADTHVARIFVFGLGARLRESTVENEKTRRSDMGGWSQMHWQRRVDEQRQQHVKEAMQALEKTVRRENVEHVILAGDDVALALLREQLTPALQARLVDMLKMDVRTAEHELLAASLEALRRREAENDVERVQRLLDDYRAGGMAAAGLRETEAALAIGQVHELLISADPMSVRPVEEQDIIDGADEAVQAAVERAAGAADPVADRQAQVDLCDRLVALARQTDARVHFVEDPALLAPVGGVGATLRYRLDVQSGDARLG